MKGLIIINAYPNGAKFYRQAERIAEELRALGCETDVKRNGEIYATLDNAGKVSLSFAEQYDFAIYLDKDKYLGKALEASGLKLYNSAQAIETCDDKMQTYFALRNAGVAVARTIPAPLCYTPNVKADEKFLENVAKKLGFPLVVKKSYGSFGAGVQLVHGIPELIETANKFLYEPHFYQEFIEQSSGKDIRVIVIGGKVVAAMERVAQKGEFRSNVELGGVGRKIDLLENYAQTAIKAAKALGLDYCGVDILEKGDGLVCEVNSNAFFEGIESVTGVNVAKAYAKYILSNR